MRLTNKNTIGYFVLTLGFLTAPAQSQPSQSPPTAATVEQTGCLSKSGDAFTLRNDETGSSVSLAGGADLAQHVGHTVKVSGTRIKSADQPDTLRVQSITHVAGSCAETSKAETAKTAAGADAAAKPQGPTADDQGMTREDQEITRKIRVAVIGDKTLSTYAHNVKIITQNGMVTLRGPVRSEAEKRSIEAKAKTVAGDAQVTNDLSVTQDGENSSSKKGEQ
jgi:osmotically-inducible protein OsmY